MNRTGFDPAKSMDSVFAQNTSAEMDFDLMFDQDDQLIDIVAGFNEAGEPLAGVDFETLHQDSYNDKPSDFKDELETNGDEQGASKPEGTFDYKDNSVAVGKGGESEASKFEKDADEEYQKEKLEPKHEDAFDLFGIFDEAEEPIADSDGEEEAPDEAPVDEECADKSDSDDADDAIEEAAINLYFMEAEEGTAFDKVKDEDAEARNSKFCNCGKSDCPICGKVQPPAVQKVDLDEAADEPEADQSDPDDNADSVDEAALDLFLMEADEETDSVDDVVDDDDDSDDAIDEAALNLYLMEAEECKASAKDASDDEETVKEEADENQEPSDTQPDPVPQEPNDGEVDDNDAIEEAAINLFFIEAESVDKDVKKEVKEDDGDEEDEYVSSVDKNKKKAGKLEYEYSDEELIDSLM